MYVSITLLIGSQSHKIHKKPKQNAVADPVHGLMDRRENATEKAALGYKLRDERPNEFSKGNDLKKYPIQWKKEREGNM